jgi:hypothetical protein
MSDTSLEVFEERPHNDQLTWNVNEFHSGDSRGPNYGRQASNYVVCYKWTHHLTTFQDIASVVITINEDGFAYTAKSPHWCSSLDYIPRRIQY